MRAVLPKIAAVVLPLLVLTGAVSWLTAPLPTEPSARLLEVRANLKKTPPGIFVVGNSKALTDIDRAAIKTALDYDGNVVTTSVSSTSAPAWYAVLEQEVFGAGYTPDLVIVYGQLGAMLRTEAPLAFERKHIEDLLSGPSPVLEAKVLGPRTSPSAIARNRATQAHTDLLAAIRDVSVGLTLAPDRSAGVAEAGAAIAVPALDTLLGGKAKFRTTEATRVVPVVDEKRGGAMSAGDTRPRDALLADFVALAKAHGATIVFARAPLAPRNTSDVVDAAVEAEALALLNELGASWIDLRALNLGAEHFSDPYHASPSGRGRISAALGEALAAARVLDGGTLAARPPLLPTAVVRVGEPAPIGDYTFEPFGKLPCAFVAKLPARFAFVAEDVLAASGFPKATPLVVQDAEGVVPRAPNAGFGKECVRGWQHRRVGAVVSPSAAPPEGLTVSLAPELSVPAENGDPVWWVYPGTGTEWRFDAPPDGGVAAVRVEARAPKGASATLRVGDVSVPLLPEGRLLRATLSAPVAGAWTLGVDAGPDTWLILDALTLGEEVPQRLVSAPVATVNALFSKRFSAPTPPALPVAGAPEVRDGVVNVPLAGLSAIADDALEARVGRACSPIVATAGETALPDPHQKPGRLATGRGYRHAGDALLLAPPGPKMPEGPYTYALDPKRKCGPATWVYPGDVQVWKFGEEVMSRVGLPPNRIAVAGIAAATGGHAAGPLRFVLRDRKNTVLFSGETHLPTEGGPARVCIPVEPPIVTSFLTLEVQSPHHDTWFLLEEAQLVDAEHDAGCAP